MRIMRCLLFTLFLGCLATAADAGEKHALLIGIQEYAGEPLAGSLNDVSLTKSILTERFSFRQENIKTLIDGEATHKGIQAGFAWLAERVKAGDTVYIHYSGHGSFTQDRKHSTWVSYGARPSERAQEPSNDIDDYDVLDSEIKQWLKPVYAKTSNVILVVDSCHSGFFVRGKGRVRVRSVQSDPRPHPLAAEADAAPMPVGARVSAAKIDEFAPEYRPDGGDQVYGRFTWFWTRALKNVEPGETWNDVYSRAANLTSMTNFDDMVGQFQHPAFYGDTALQVLEGAGFRPPSAAVPVFITSPLSGGRAKVYLNAGELEGVTKGSLYRKKGDPTATVEIIRVAPFESEGEGTGSFQQGDLLVEEAHRYPYEPTKLYVKRSAVSDAAIEERLVGALQRLSGYSLVSGQDDADYVLTVLRPTGASPQVRLLTGDGRPVAGTFVYDCTANADWLGGLTGDLRKLARVKALRLLVSPEKVPVDVRITRWVETRDCGAGAACRDFRVSQTDPSPRKFRMKEKGLSMSQMQSRELDRGEVLTFELRNRSKEERFYCYLIDISPNRKVEFLFPRQEDYKKALGTRDPNLLEKASGGAGSVAEVSARIVVNAPGEETVKLIVSKQPVPGIFLLAQDGVVDKGFAGRGGATMNPLEELLMEAAAGAGLSARGPDPTTWGADQFTFIGK